VNPILLDSGVIVALLDRNERLHNRCATVVTRINRPLVTCEPVIAESCHLLRGAWGAPQAVLENVLGGVFLVPFQLSPCVSAVRNIMRKYAELPIDLADACLICLAEQLHTGDILTLDRDFQFYRWSRNRSFEMLISLD
jgi:uncharacterized protein